MQDIKNKIEEKIPHLLLAIVDSKESEIDEESCTKEYINIKRTLWEELSFIKQSSIKVKVVNFDNFEFEQNEPFYDTEKKIIYYKDDTEVDEFSDILIDIFKVPKSLNGDFKYILTKVMSKIKILNEEFFDRINVLWIKIHETKKEEIVKKLKNIGFNENIKFQFHYTQNAFDSATKKTEEEIQSEINKILEDEKFKIIFTCEQNKPLAKVDTNNKNLEGYNTDSSSPEEDKEITNNKSNDKYKSTSVQVNKDRKQVESNREAKKRGLEFEDKLVKDLAKEWKNEKDEIIELAKNTYTDMKEETLNDKITKRFDFKNDKYHDTLNNGNLEDILHISKNLGDGVGFDILIPREENGELKLLKVEVKSSERGKSIYLTENERKEILLYKINKAKKIDESFRVFLYIKGKKNPKDITDKVFKILEKNKDFENIRAETWILDI